MGLFRNNNSWSSQAKGSGGFFHPEKKCPPIDDCDVKNFVGSRRVPAGLTSRQKRQLANLKKKQAKIRQAEAKAAKTQQRQRSWPNAGKYTP